MSCSTISSVFLGEGELQQLKLLNHFHHLFEREEEMGGGSCQLELLHHFHLFCRGRGVRHLALFHHFIILAGEEDHAT